jgi:hypothetical protein
MVRPVNHHAQDQLKNANERRSSAEMTGFSVDTIEAAPEESAAHVAAIDKILTGRHSYA